MRVAAAPSDLYQACACAFGCEHGRVRSACTECGGDSALFIHGRVRSTCKIGEGTNRRRLFGGTTTAIVRPAAEGNEDKGCPMMFVVSCRTLCGCLAEWWEAAPGAP